MLNDTATACDTSPQMNIDACCNNCDNQLKCKEGYSCWDYVSFVTHGVVLNEDRRISKRIYTEVVCSERTYSKKLRETIDDYEEI